MPSRYIHPTRLDTVSSSIDQRRGEVKEMDKHQITDSLLKLSQKMNANANNARQAFHMFDPNKEGYPISLV